MATVTLSTRVPREFRDEVDTLAAALGRDRAWIVEQAVRQYVEAERQFLDDVHAGLAEIDRGDYVAWDTVKQDLAQLLDTAPE